MENELEPLRLLSIKEAAEVLRVHPRTVKTMIRRNELPAFKVRSQWRLRESELARRLLEGVNEL
jgi:excisionase family DNA binding protein